MRAPDIRAATKDISIYADLTDCKLFRDVTRQQASFMPERTNCNDRQSAGKPLSKIPTRLLKTDCDS
jgi:hypothetical protein